MCLGAVIQILGMLFVFRKAKEQSPSGLCFFFFGFFFFFFFCGFSTKCSSVDCTVGNLILLLVILLVQSLIND